jgi:hypothetical protein
MPLRGNENRCAVGVRLVKTQVNSSVRRLSFKTNAAIENPPD